MTRLCQHFGICGGCTLQDIPEFDYRARKHRLVVDTLARAGVDARVDDMVSVPPFTRRRVALKLAKKNGNVEIGFHVRASHEIVDLKECQVLTSGLTALVQSLRAAFAPLLNDGDACNLDITETDTGFDLGLGWARKPSPALVAGLARIAARLGIARIARRGEILIELVTPSVSFAGAQVKFPPGAFLQPTREGESVLQTRVLAMLGHAKNIADLFAGCGTFALTLAREMRVHAVEKDAAMLAALAASARGASGLKPITTEKRDLFRRPLGEGELSRFDAVLLDPPRVGAGAQIRTLAASKIRRIVYVSCDAGSFARDAQLLAKADFTLGPVTPIDQFLWSGHIELVASFERG